MNIMKLLLDIITTYSRDIGMNFGKDKCAYVLIESFRSRMSTSMRTTLNNAY